MTSNTSSLPEVARDTALLVDPYDVRQIAQAMWLVLSQPALAAELRARGLARAAQFTWERTAEDGRRRSAVGGQQSAVSSQRSAVSGQQSAVSSRRQGD